MTNFTVAGILTSILILQGCGLWESKPDEPWSLELIDQLDLDIPEPSGLSLGSDGSLYTVSDPPNNRIYVLEKSGQLKRTLSYEGDDLEGISYDYRDSSLWVIEEGLSELVHISNSGVELSRWQVAFEVNDSNQGFEGIVMNQFAHETWIAVQANPPTLIKLDVNKVIVEELEIEFASNLTGICEGRSEDEYFLISDRDKRLYIWSPGDGLQNTFSFDVPDMEGIAFDQLNGTIYLVSDSRSTLSSYRFPVEGG